MTGLEVDREAAAKATSRGLEVLVGDVQTSPLTGIVGGRRFDVVVLADVLEHLLEPRELLVQLHEVLAPGGRVLVSVPNITHVDIQVMLAQDDWRYRSSGLLDRTHLRFFSIGTFSEMAFATGFDLVSAERVVVPGLGTEVLDFGKRLTLSSEQVERIRAAVEAANDNALTYQHVLVLEPAPERTAAVVGEPTLELPAPSEEHGAAGRPMVDIVVFTEPGRADLTAALLRALPQQTYQNFAVTVVLRGPDATALEEFGQALGPAAAGSVPWVLVAGGPSRGQALNTGLELAHHEYVAFWTDDDGPADTFLQGLVDLLERKPWLSAGYGACRIAEGEPGSGSWRDLGEVGSLAQPFDRIRMLTADALPLSGVLMRVSDLRRSRLHFDEVPGGYPEWSFIAGLAAAHEMELLPSAIFTTWLHGRRQAPVPGKADERQRRLLATAAQRDGALSARVRRDEIRRMTAERDRIGEELEATREHSRHAVLAVQGELDRVLASRSWKLTRVLRRLTHSRLPE